MIRFYVIVPTFNSAGVLDQCLASLLALQRGRFELHVHIQDGGSSDDTLAIASNWRSRTQHLLTINSQPDNGLYDALVKATIALDDDCIMTWLGSDDVLMPGAIATVASIFAQSLGVAWLTGLPLVGSEDDGTFTPWPPSRYIR